MTRSILRLISVLVVSDEPVWSPFADRESVERRMTDEIHSNVTINYGFLIQEAAGA